MQCIVPGTNARVFAKAIRSLSKIGYATAPLAGGYKPRDVESEILSLPETYHASNSGKQPTYRMILPPPNVTGYLHLGHALMSTVQDVICRRKRQEGFHVAWIPGTDHAGIATQVVVEKKLLKEKQLTRHQISRDAFLQEIVKWKRDKENVINRDLKRLGCTLNWEQEYFTMDESRSNAVTEAFIRLFDSGIIQRKNRLVNWSCVLESTISDIEVDTCEINGQTGINVPGYNKPVMFGEIHDIVYKVQGTNRTITVSTTRPETILGDVAIAVHPDDPKYSEFQPNSTFVVHPFRNCLLPVVFDASVDREFGTGAVKVTPAHDKSDFELAQRHSLASVQVFTENGVVTEDFQEFAKQPRFIARQNVIQALKERGLYLGAKPHKMQLPICSRSGDVIEYMLRPQWFVDCTDMAQQAMEAVRAGKIKIHPSNFEHDWFRWLEDCKEWCISRQIWWGHRVPAYLCETDGKSTWIAARSSDEARQKAEQLFQLKDHQIKISQDADVLDTWFSSSLLPLSAFGWPIGQCQALNLMETGHDILFFWVARMVMMGIKLTGDVPFLEILLNGIVCDVHGRKMSKSLGNVILPEQVIYGATLDQLLAELQKSFNIGTLSKVEMEKSMRGLKQTYPQGIPECGIDALRFTLCSYNIKSHFINFDMSECHTNKLFFNKIWQATRYTLHASEKLNIKDISAINIRSLQLSEFDRWILSRLGKTKKICDDSFESFNFHFAVTALKAFFYKNLCDVYLETTKPNITDGNEAAKSHYAVLSICLSLGLQNMSPFTPFLSQMLLQRLPNFDDFEYEKYLDNTLEAEVEDILDICTAIRQLKSQNNISKKHEPVVHLYSKSESAFRLLDQYKGHIQTLCLAKVVLEELNDEKDNSNFTLMSTASHLCTFAIETNHAIETNSKSDSVNTKKLEKLQASLKKLLTTISSEGYRKSASESVQRRHLEKIKEIESEIGSIKSLK